MILITIWYHTFYHMEICIHFFIYNTRTFTAYHIVHATLIRRQKLAEQIPVLFEYNQLVFCQKTPEIHNMVLPVICKQPLADKCNPYAFSGITLNNCCNRKFNLSPF